MGATYTALSAVVGHGVRPTPNTMIGRHESATYLRRRRATQCRPQSGCSGDALGLSGQEQRRRWCGAFERAHVDLSRERADAFCSRERRRVAREQGEIGKRSGHLSANAHYSARTRTELL